MCARLHASGGAALFAVLRHAFRDLLLRLPARVLGQAARAGVCGEAHTCATAGLRLKALGFRL